MRTKTALLCLFVLPFSLAACGNEAKTDPSAGGPKANQESAAKPTKEGLLTVLRQMNEALDKKDYKAAAGLLQPFPTIPAEKMEGAVATFQEKKEISGAGIELLAAKGKFGPLMEIFPRRGEGFAKKAGVEAATCHAISLDGAEVAAHWDGKTFHLIRLDDVGKLK